MMNKWRIYNLIVGIVFILQPFLFYKEEPFVSGFLLGIGFCILMLSEVIVPIMCQIKRDTPLEKGESK